MLGSDDKAHPLFQEPCQPLHPNSLLFGTLGTLWSGAANVGMAKPSGGREGISYRAALVHLIPSSFVLVFLTLCQLGQLLAGYQHLQGLIWFMSSIKVFHL